jgi:hypothetical protein
MTGKTDSQIIDSTEDDEITDVGGGSFSQEQVNAIVRDRLARQKAQLTKTQGTLAEQLATLQAQVEQLSADKAKYADKFSASLVEKKSGLPDGILKLLEKMDPVDQLAWIDENAATLVPATQPPATGPQAPKPKEAPSAVQSAEEKVSLTGLYYGI